jgi:hypothetical protein
MSGGFDLATGLTAAGTPAVGYTPPTQDQLLQGQNFYQGNPGASYSNFFNNGQIDPNSATDLFRQMAGFANTAKMNPKQFEEYLISSTEFANPTNPNTMASNTGGVLTPGQPDNNLPNIPWLRQYESMYDALAGQGYGDSYTEMGQDLSKYGAWLTDPNAPWNKNYDTPQAQQQGLSDWWNNQQGIDAQGLMAILILIRLLLPVLVTPP